MEGVITDKRGGMLLSIDKHILNTPYPIELHTHHDLEISTVVSGHARYSIGGHIYDLQPGDVIVLNNFEPHGLILEEGVELHHLVIHFNPSFIWNALADDLNYNFLSIFFRRSASFSNLLDRENAATAQIVGVMWEIMDEINERRPCYELVVKIKLETIFALMIRHYDYVDIEHAAEPLPAEYIPLFNEVRRYIDAHLAEDIRLADLAAIVHVSPAYFSVLFKRFNLVSPVEYIIYHRVRRAVELIRTTNMNLTEVAIACGFNNGTNFYKAFRKVTGRTPSSYRNAKH